MIPLTRPYMGDEEEAAAIAVLRSGWRTLGPKVTEFEAAFADYVGADHAIAVSNGTAALHLALRALDVGPGDEIICPALASFATANAVVYCGATPVLVDVDGATYNIDADAVAAAITPRTRAVLIVHQLGLPADLERVQALADGRGLVLVEDAAGATGALYHGVRIGRPHGALACSSFEPRGGDTIGEGSMVTTSDAALAARVRRLRRHEISLSDAQPELGGGAVDSGREIGYDYPMTDLQAAVGIEQLRKLGGVMTRRRALAHRYTQALAGVPDLATPLEPAGVAHPFPSYMVRVGPEARLGRDALMARLLAEGIATRRGVTCIHQDPPYRQRLGKLWLPTAERVSDEGLLLPLYAQMTDAEQRTVIGALTAALG